MAILDLTLVGELSVITMSSMQAVKSHPKIKGSMIPYLSGIVGAILGVSWFAVSGDLLSDTALWGVDWANAFRGVFDGIVGAVGANAGYNLQKVLLIPNLLPTTGEMDAQKLKEEVDTQQAVVQAVESGVEPETAKETVGLDKDDPPPNVDLEQIQPTVQEVADSNDAVESPETN